MTILVTGGSGLVGRALQKLVENDSTFVFLSSSDCDLRCEEKVEEIFEKYKPDTVVHLASIVAGLYGNMDNNYKFLIDNIKINTNILENCNKFKVKKLVNILSTCIFPEQNEYNNLTYPLTSNQILNGKPHSSNAGYAHAKRLLYVGSKLLTNTSNIQVINLIPTNLYGTNDNYNLHKSHVIPGLIHKIYLAQKTNTHLIIKGSGKAKRQFLYVNDFANIILYFINTTLQNPFNALVVSPEKQSEITIKELVYKLIKIFQFNGKIIFDTDYSDGQDLKTTDNTELLHYIPSFKFTSLDIGLSETIDYFIKHYDNVRK